MGSAEDRLANLEKRSQEVLLRNVRPDQSLVPAKGLRFGGLMVVPVRRLSRLLLCSGGHGSDRFVGDKRSPILQHPVQHDGQLARESDFGLL